MIRVLAKERSGWEPHYNDVKRHVTIPKGTEVSVLAELDEPWDDNPGCGHTYWHLGWTDENGEVRRTWIRTYSHVQITPLFEPTELPGEGEVKP